jgi:hypothetical protein
MCVVLRLEADGQEAQDLHQLEVRLVFEGKESIWQATPIVFKEVPADETYSYVNLVMNINAPIERAGAGRIQLRIDGLGGPPDIAFRVQALSPDEVRRHLGI